MTERGEVTITDMMIKQMQSLTDSVDKQREVLVRVETHQIHHAQNLDKLSKSVDSISLNQVNCPARNGYNQMRDKVDMLQETTLKKKSSSSSNPPPRRTTWGRIPLPSPQDLKRILPWLVAIGAGVAAAMGWIDDPSELLK